MLKRLLLICLFTNIWSWAQGFESIQIEQPYLNANVVSNGAYLNTPSDPYPILEVISPAILRQFTPVHGSEIGYHQLASETWLTFAVDNLTKRSLRLFLDRKPPFWPRQSCIITSTPQVVISTLQPGLIWA